jgi:hypothetical protein
MLYDAIPSMFFAPFAPFCLKLAQVPVYEQLTTIVGGFPIKLNQA